MTDSRADRLATLAPVVAARCQRVEALAREAGLRIRWTQTLRSIEDQRRLYAIGRDRDGVVLDPGAVVTHAPPGYSWHEYGLAADFCLLKDAGAVEWSTLADTDQDGLVDWLEVGRIGEACGLAWGGRWRKPDLPHLEYHPGLLIVDARRLYSLSDRTAALRAVWAAVEHGAP